MERGSGFGSLLFSAGNLLQGEAVTYVPVRGPRGPCPGTLPGDPARSAAGAAWLLAGAPHAEHNTSQAASSPAGPWAWRPPSAGTLQRQNPPCPSRLPSLFRQAALSQRLEERLFAKTPALLLLPCNSHCDCCLWEDTAGNIFPGNLQATCLLHVAGKSCFAENQSMSKGN